MPLLDAHQPGMLCWVELATLDTAAAKKFYEDLFGWTHNEFPIGDSDVYTIFRLRDRDAAAAYSMMKDQRDAGIPPNWLLYVAVTNVDDTVARATGLGGKTIGPPMDVFEMGRMAVLQDPVGAVFALWQPNTHKGMGVANEPGAFCWGELMTPDVQKAKAFYTSLFGWGTDTMPMPEGMEYTLFKVGEAPSCGMFPNPPGHESIPPYWTPYFAVNDCDATVAKAKANGGQVFVPPTDIPNIGRFSTMADPQGATFAVLKQAPMPQA